MTDTDLHSHPCVAQACGVVGAPIARGFSLVGSFVGGGSSSISQIEGFTEQA